MKLKQVFARSCALFLMCCCLGTTTVHADPFEFQLSGTWTKYAHIGVGPWDTGPNYTLTIIADNGGTSPVNQFYGAGDIVSMAVDSGALSTGQIELTASQPSALDFGFSTNAAGEWVLPGTWPGGRFVTSAAIGRYIDLGTGLIQLYQFGHAYDAFVGEEITSTPGTPPGGGPDSDGDGVPDDEDICDGGDDNIDTDGDLVPDFCDTCPFDFSNDADGDGVCGDVDVCAGGDDTINTDGDAIPDFCDACPLDFFNDADNDGVCGDEDNCPLTENPDQSDLDWDDEGDACDLDIDGDGVPNSTDNCKYDANADQADFDLDGAGDICDDDIDADGVVDAVDACVPTPVGEVVNADGCSIAEICPCNNNWKNHGAYVRSVAHASEDFLADGLISEAEKDAIVSAAAQSDCGHRNR